MPCHAMPCRTNSQFQFYFIFSPLHSIFLLFAISSALCRDPYIIALFSRSVSMSCMDVRVLVLVCAHFCDTTFFRFQFTMPVASTRVCVLCAYLLLYFNTFIRMSIFPCEYLLDIALHSHYKSYYNLVRL